MVYSTDDGQLADVPDRIGLKRLHQQPLLFAIARDARTIFASWSVDWRSVFENAIPADRTVHLRLIGSDGIIETTVAVEPMSEMHYMTISGFHDSYRVEMGYFQPFPTWHSVVTSNEVEIPSQESIALAAVDLATIPFHLSFDQLANLLGAAKDTSIATIASDHQKRLLSRGKPNEESPFDTEILRSLNLSRPDMAAAVHDYKKIDTEKLVRRARAKFLGGSTSPVRGFQANAGP